MKLKTVLIASLLGFTAVAAADDCKRKPEPVDSAFWEGIWVGTIGGANITLCINGNEVAQQENLEGAYYYNKRRKAIRLVQRWDAPYLWQEEFPQGGISGNWEITAEDGKITGTWSDPHGRKRLPISLKNIRHSSYSEVACISSAFTDLLDADDYEHFKD